MSGILTGNALKIIAMLSMLIDHIGVILLNDYEPFRIIGRLAFPLYAFLISEGCRHTKNKLFYFLRIFALGMVCQTVYYFTDRSLYLNILLTFSVSILLIYIMEYARKNIFFTLCFLIATVLLWKGLGQASQFEISFDYGFYGIMFPVLLSLSDNKKEKLILAFFGLFLLSEALGGIQIWSIMAIIPMLMYNGKRGKMNLKAFFYLFYPLHLAVLWGIQYLLQMNIFK